MNFSHDIAYQPEGFPPYLESDVDRSGDTRHIVVRVSDSITSMDPFPPLFQVLSPTTLENETAISESIRVITDIESWPLSSQMLSLITIATTQDLTFQTSPSHTYDRIQQEFEDIVSRVTETDFEGSSNSEFVEELLSIIGHHGDEIVGLILKKRVDLGLAADVLEIAGLIEKPDYEIERRNLLERCLLESKSNWVRDGAMKGISYLDNPQSLPAVEKAITKETLPRLKRYMMRVAQRLRDKRAE